MEPLKRKILGAFETAMFEVLQFHSFKLVLYLNDGIEWSRSLLNLNTRGSAIALRPFYILYLFWNG